MKKIIFLLAMVASTPAFSMGGNPLIDNINQIRDGIIERKIAPTLNAIYAATTTLGVRISSETAYRIAGDLQLSSVTAAQQIQINALILSTGTIGGGGDASLTANQTFVGVNHFLNGGNIYHGDGSLLTGLIGGVEVDPLSVHRTGDFMTGDLVFNASQPLAGGTPTASSEQVGSSGTPNIPAVPLGQTAHFAVLGGAGITNSGTTNIITGDLGASPTPAITGFPLTLDMSGTYSTTPSVIGKVYQATNVSPTPTMLTAAQADLTIAYNNAMGRTPVPTGAFLNPNSGNLCGQTLVAGLYKFTAVGAATCNFSLSGGADDVWIFQVGSALNIASGVQMTLSGGANARNVFWAVGTSANLGSGVLFQGTIIADQSVTMNTTVTLNGRALASIADVTLLDDTITIPTPLLSFSSHTAVQAFDGNIATYWESVGGTPQYLGYDFGLGNAFAITSYIMTNVGNGGFLDPVDFIFEGSNDDITYSPLDTRAGIVWTQPEAKTFTVASPAAYRYYRVNVSSSLTNVGISELSFTKSSATVTIDPVGSIVAIGTITANRFIGDGSLLTGIVTGGGDAVLAATQTFTGGNTFTSDFALRSNYPQFVLAEKGNTAPTGNLNVGFMNGMGSAILANRYLDLGIMNLRASNAGAGGGIVFDTVNNMMQIFTSSTAVNANDVAPDRTAIMIDGDNDSIAIFNNNFTHTLSVYGDANFTSSVTASGLYANALTITDGNQGVGKVLTSDANGFASWQTGGGGGMTYPYTSPDGLMELGVLGPYGRSEIHFSSPTATLRLGAAANDGDAFYSTSEGIVIYGTKLNATEATLARIKADRFALSDTGDIYAHYRFLANRDGLYTANNTANKVFQVINASSKTIVNGVFQYTDLGATYGEGKVLTSDASGNATWTAAAGGGDVVLAATQTFTGLNRFDNSSGSAQIILDGEHTGSTGGDMLMTATPNFTILASNAYYDANTGNWLASKTGGASAIVTALGGGSDTGTIEILVSSSAVAGAVLPLNPIIRLRPANGGNAPYVSMQDDVAMNGNAIRGTGRELISQLCNAATDCSAWCTGGKQTSGGTCSSQASGTVYDGELLTDRMRCTTTTPTNLRAQAICYNINNN